MRRHARRFARILRSDVLLCPMTLKAAAAAPSEGPRARRDPDYLAATSVLRTK